MRPKFALLAVPALALAPIVASPALAQSVEVTRFHTPETLAGAQPGPIALAIGPQFLGSDLEAKAWLDAVGDALTRQGFTIDPAATRTAVVSLDQKELTEPVEQSGTHGSIGIGVGSGGGYRRSSGVSLGLGFGINLGSKKPRGTLATTLSVMIRNGEGVHMWEGRAQADPRMGSKDARPDRLAPKMADALFSGFPGQSGETIGAR